MTFIDQVLPEVREQQKGGESKVTLERAHVGIVSGIVSMVDEIPEELLPSDATHYTELLAALSALRAAVGMWQSQGSSYTLRNLPGMGYSPIFLVRRALNGLPDAVPDPDTEELTFLADHDLIKALRLDMSTATSALRNGEWKAATVIAGSVIEALLLWSITRHKQIDWEQAMQKVVAQKLVSGRRDQPDRWHMSDYVEVAGEVGCITDRTRTEARLTKEYRNLIHPGRAQRTGEQCNMGTAHVAVGAMDHVVSELTAKGAAHACP